MAARTASTAHRDPAIVLLRNCSLIVQGSSLIAIMIGLLVLFGWRFDVPVFTSVLVGAATMKPNTALCFVLAGIGLWTLHLAPTAGKSVPQQIGQICAALIGVVAVLTLSEYLFSFNIGIDTLLYPTIPLDQHGGPTGRMVPATAVAFGFLSVALFLLRSDTQARRWIVQCCASMVALIGLIATLGYAYGIEDLYRFYSFTSVALHTALVLIVLGAGVMLARPDYGLAAVLTSPHGGGFLARRVIPIAVVSTFLIGWLRLAGERAGWYGTAFGLALFASTVVAMFVILTAISARTLNRIDAERQDSQVALQKSEQRLRDLVDGLGPYMFVGLMSLDGTIVYANRSALEAAGLQPEDVLGKRCEETYWWSYSETIQQQLRAAIDRAAHGEASRYDVQIRVTENQFIFIDFSIQPVRDRDGKVVYLVPSAIVINERKLAEEKILGQLDELMRWQKVTLGREGRVREMKAEVNQLLAAQGQPARYADTESS